MVRLPGGGMKRLDAFEVANDWYQEEHITKAIQNSGSTDFGACDAIPKDVYSNEFAHWLTHQYRLAMMKGIQLAEEND